MKLWIDGGSLHATLRCLKQIGTPEDAASLLHVAGKLVFADKILVGSYGLGHHYEKSLESLEILEELGVYKGTVEIIRMDEHKCEKIYAKAGDQIAPYVQSLFKRVEEADNYTQLAEHQSAMEKRFHEVLQNGLTHEGRKDLYEKIKFKENNGFLVMATQSSNFWREVTTLVSESKLWNEIESAKLATACRAFIHTEAAADHQSFYAPGRKRAKPLSQFNFGEFPERLSEHIQKLPEQVIKDSGKNLLKDAGLPPVEIFLTCKAKGSPKKVFEEALRLRDRTGPLRSHMARIIQSAQENKKPALDLNRNAEELADELKKYMKSSAAGKFALNFAGKAIGWAYRTAFVGISTNDALSALKDAGELYAGVRSLANTQSIVVLSEISATLAWESNLRDLVDLQHAVSAKGMP